MCLFHTPHSYSKAMYSRPVQSSTHFTSSAPHSILFVLVGGANCCSPGCHRRGCGAIRCCCSCRGYFTSNLCFSDRNAHNIHSASIHAPSANASARRRAGRIQGGHDNRYTLLLTGLVSRRKSSFCFQCSKLMIASVWPVMVSCREAYMHCRYCYKSSQIRPL